MREIEWRVMNFVHKDSFPGDPTLAGPLTQTFCFICSYLFMQIWTIYIVNLAMKGLKFMELCKKKNKLEGAIENPEVERPGRVATTMHYHLHRRRKLNIWSVKQVNNQ